MTPSPQISPPPGNNAKTTIKLALVLSAGLVLAWLLYLVLTPAPVLPPPKVPATQAPAPPS